MVYRQSLLHTLVESCGERHQKLYVLGCLFEYACIIVGDRVREGVYREVGGCNQREKRDRLDAGLGRKLWWGTSRCAPSSAVRQLDLDVTSAKMEGEVPAIHVRREQLKFSSGQNTLCLGVASTLHFYNCYITE